MDQIIIKQDYFDHIKNAVDAINEFFGSEFNKKNFSFLIENEDLDSSIKHIITIMDDVDPTFVAEPERVQKVLEDLEENDQSDIDESMRGAIDSIIAFYALQNIADNFNQFAKLINGIYTFDLYLNPSKYKEEIEHFSEPIDLPYQLDEYDIDCVLFKPHEYVAGLLNDDRVKLPIETNVESETSRIISGRDASNTEVVIDTTSSDDDSPTVNESAKPKDIGLTIISKNIKFNGKTGKFELSKQCKDWVDKLISGLRKCETTEDLNTFFEKELTPSEKFVDIPIPYILAKVYLNEKKFHKDPPTVVLTLKEKVYDKKLKVRVRSLGISL